MTAIGVVGEAVVDLLPDADVLRPHVGGSPVNVAVGLARLGIDARLLSPTSSDGWGGRVRRHLQAEGVQVAGSVIDAPTALAVVDVASDGQPSYRFLWEDTADGRLDAHAFRAALGSLDAVHVGSVGAVRGQAGAVLDEVLPRAGHDLVVSYDPNVRVDVLPDLPSAVSRMRRLASSAHVVKASVEDLEVLAPGADRAQAARQLLAGQRTALVVVTDGGRGADLWTRHGTEHVAVQPSAVVVDTVGAGDTFMAALLVGLDDHDALTVAALEHLDLAAAVEAATFAARAAGVVVGRRGADPPRRDDLAESPS